MCVQHSVKRSAEDSADSAAKPSKKGLPVFDHVLTFHAFVTAKKASCSTRESKKKACSASERTLVEFLFVTIGGLDDAARCLMALWRAENVTNQTLIAPPDAVMCCKAQPKQKHHCQQPFVATSPAFLARCRMVRVNRPLKGNVSREQVSCVVYSCVYMTACLFFFLLRRPRRLTFLPENHRNYC